MTPEQQAALSGLDTVGYIIAAFTFVAVVWAAWALWYIRMGRKR